MHTAALIVGAFGAYFASAASSSALPAPSVRSAEPLTIAEVAAIETEPAEFLSREGRSAPAANETRSVRRITLSRVERKLGPTSCRSEVARGVVSFAVLHQLSWTVSTHELRERLTLFCTWIV